MELHQQLEYNSAVGLVEIFRKRVRQAHQSRVVLTTPEIPESDFSKRLDEASAQNQHIKEVVESQREDVKLDMIAARDTLIVERIKQLALVEEVARRLKVEESVRTIEQHLKKTHGESPKQSLELHFVDGSPLNGEYKKYDPVLSVKGFEILATAGTTTLSIDAWRSRLIPKGENDSPSYVPLFEISVEYNLPENALFIRYRDNREHARSDYSPMDTHASFQQSSLTPGEFQESLFTLAKSWV